jgi:pyruvate dehydrogenase E2 component (dihydrolipoyllysine-residue acetyltransferase)
MPIEVLMPALSPTMTEGNLAKWHKKEGDEVKAGDILAEIETDKATMEFEAADEGVLGKILVPEGTEGVKVNEPIALILGEGEDKAALEKARPVAAKAPPKPESAPAPEKAEAAAAANKPVPAPVAPKTAPPPPRAAAAPQPAPAPRGNGHAEGERIFVSPLARRMAEQAGIDLARLTGSGPHGRIVKSDIEAALGKGPAALKAPAVRAPAPAAVPAGAPVSLPSYRREQVLALAGNPPYEEVPLTSMRRIIAKRMQEAKATIPHFYLTVDCEIDLLLRMRKEINENTDLKVSVNDFVIKAVALALMKVPAANASFSEDAILRWKTADIAVAVALDDGLITPIVKHAEQKGVGAIAAEMKDLAARARAGKLKLQEFQGGTFSISNLGMYGIKDFAAVINPPQGGILAVGAGEQRPVVKNGQVTVATIMSCTIACDHRAVDGATGAQWLQQFKKIIEAPAMLAL